MCTRNADGNTATVRGAVEELTNLALRGENNYVREWKQAGNKVVGFTCSYVPEEILYAGNKTSKVLPFRMGAEQCESTEDADIYLHKFACGYVKCLLQLGLRAREKIDSHLIGPIVSFMNQSSIARHSFEALFKGKSQNIRNENISLDISF
jgi:hypothetical protein